MSTNKNRATTDEFKRAVIECLYAAWVANPELRLGQLVNSAMVRGNGTKRDLFYIEDTDFAMVVLDWGEK